MTTDSQKPDLFAPVDVELKDPIFAGFLAWLLPGAGHMYQGRYGKGSLFSICILSTFFFGLYLGGGQVVYAAWNVGEDNRYAYLCQVGVGLPALPALMQAVLVRNHKEPLWNGFMAPPRPAGAPRRVDDRDEADPGELADWHLRLHRYFELGTLFTMVAGLLNVLAIYDAACGPVFTDKEDEPTEPSKSEPAKTT